jgi:hypothetical protein
MDRNRIELRYNSCKNNYLLELEDYESLYPPSIDKIFYDISPSYKYLKTEGGNNKNRCICFVTMTIPTILNSGPSRIINSYYNDNEFNDLKKHNNLEIKCNHVLSQIDMLLYTGIINDNWYIPINNLYSIGNPVKENIYENNIIISEYCLNIFNMIKQDKSFFTPKLYYDKDLKIDIKFTETNQKDLEYIIYTIYKGKEYADNKYKLSYTNDSNNKKYLEKDINNYKNFKCVFKKKIVILKNVINEGNLNILLEDITREVILMMKKRANYLTVKLNQFAIGNMVGYFSLHLICGYTLCYFIIDKVELLRIKKIYEFNNFNDDYDIIKKYKDVFNRKLQQIFNVRMIGGDDVDNKQNLFSYYKKNTDSGYVDFINKFYKIIEKNDKTIKNILNIKIKN